jgi:hypothetical protein
MSDTKPAAIPLYAWQFSLGDDHDDGVQVVFARNEARAMILAGQQSGGGKGDRSEVTRVQNFDKYITAGTKEGANPDQADFFDEGYTVTCSECEHRVANDEDPCWRCADNAVEEAAENLEGDAQVDEDAIAQSLGGAVTAGGMVYCNRRCLDRETARTARHKARKAEAKEALARKYPFVRILGASVGGAGECEGLPEDGYHPPERYARPGDKPRKKTCYDADHDNVTVRFKVPGGEVSESTSDGNAYHNVYCHRCGHLWIARGDYAAFECHAVTPTAVVEVPAES